MSWREGIEGPALRIAECTENPLRVMAGPGTGKTFAMQRRVARLLTDDRVDPQRILAVTFTRNAAKGLLEDLHGLAIPDCENIKASTLHSFCFGLLGKEDVFSYLDRVARPLITFNKASVPQFECAPMIEDLRAGGMYGGKRDCASRIRAFEAGWARLQHENPGWPSDATDRTFQNDLVGWLRFHEGMLIGELVPETLRFLRNNPGAAELDAFDHLVVDEYQDLNKAEQVLIDKLAERGKLSVVGDVDQSIYSFRYANPEGIVEFTERHPQTHDEALLECHRCPRNVVDLADHLIRQNHPPTVPVRLNPKATNRPGEIRIVQWSQLKEESAGLAGVVQHLITDRGYQPGDILILSPRRLVGYAIRDVLRDLDVPVHSFYHEEAFEEEQSQQAFALLTLLVKPEDRVALRFWLGLGSPSWRAGEYGRLREYCENTHLSPRAVLTELVSGQQSLSRTSGIQQRYRDLLNEVDTIRSLDCQELVDRLFPQNVEWAKGLREAALHAIGKAVTGDELLDELRLQVTQPEMPEEGDFVRVMSLHKSKGLSSKVVIIADCIEGLIPTLDSRHTLDEAHANLQEQRRLFYVSMTRCREIVVLSSVLKLPAKLAYKMGARIRGRGTWGYTVASRFLDELGPNAPASIRGEDWAKGGFA